MDSENPTISLCMIVKDEEQFLEQCLSSVKELVDEIIIIDTGSADNTLEIAKRFTENIHHFEWCNDFSKARNESINHATKDWILILDADETIEKEDIEKISKAINPDSKAFRLNIVNITKQGNKIFKLVRLFRNNEGFHFTNRIHELVDRSIEEKGFNIEELDAKIIHHGLLNKTPEELKEKSESYISLILKQLEDNPNSPRYNHQAGNAYLQLNNLDKALEYYQKTADIDPHYKLIYSDIAKIYLKKRMLKEAIESYEKSSDINPDDPSSANNLAVLYGMAGHMDKAKDLIQQIIKRFPDNEAVKTNYNRIMNR